MWRVLAASVFGLLWGTTTAYAASIVTVNWAQDSSVDGTGTGTLNGTNTVTYSTATGFNAGTSIFENWASYLGTAGATGGSVTNESGGVLGGGVGGTPQEIMFTQTVINPILLINFLGGPPGIYGGDTFGFGSNPFSLLSSHNATASGNMVSSTMAVTDTADDGFGIQFNGSFGPATPLQFTYTSNGQGGNGFQSVGFTIGISQAAVPEPSSFILLGIGTFGLMVCGIRRSRVRTE